MLETHTAIVLNVKGQLRERGQHLADGEHAQEEGTDTPGWILQKSGPSLFLSFRDEGVAGTQVVIDTLTGKMTVRREGRIQVVDENIPLESLRATDVKINASEVYAVLGSVLSYMDMGTYLSLFVA